MQQRGFTLIELVIVLLIIGILAILTIPAYQDYVIKARVTEGLTMASPAQLAVAETTWRSNGFPATQAETGYVTPPSSTNVASITVANDGSATIIIVFTADAGGGTILMVPTIQANKEITWTCTGGTLAARYRPTSCK